MPKRAFDKYVEDARQYYQDEEERQSLELDRRFEAQERVHALELAAAAERHAKVRKSAERAALLHMLEYEQRLKEQEEFERQAIQQAERNLRLQEAAHRQRQREAEVSAAEEEARRLEEEAEERRLHQERLAEAAAKQEQQKQQSKQKSAGDVNGSVAGGGVGTPSNQASKAAGSQASQHEIANTTQQNNTTPQTQPSSTQLTERQPSSVSSNDAQAFHKQYLDLHQHLKKMRKHVMDYAQQDKAFKTRIGDARRSIRQILSTLSMDSKANIASRNRLVTLLRDAASHRQLILDGSSFIMRPLPLDFDVSQKQVSGALVYLLNIFAKRVIAQFVALADTKTEWADPVGIIASTIFAARDFTMNGISFIDMLLAKYHKACPILFGVKLDPRAPKPTAPFLTALGAGFAAISLRNYIKTPLQNPFPPTNFWTAVARIVNTPTPDVTEHHMFLLRAMLEAGASRFIDFFGQAALVAIQKAVVDFPKKVPIPVAAAQLATLQSIFEKKLRLNINYIQLAT